MYVLWFDHHAKATDYLMLALNPLSANVVHARYDVDVVVAVVD